MGRPSGFLLARACPSATLRLQSLGVLSAGWVGGGVVRVDASPPVIAFRGILVGAVSTLRRGVHAGRVIVGGSCPALSTPPADASQRLYFSTELQPEGHLPPP